jgi:hypothetical protein
MGPWLDQTLLFFILLLGVQVGLGVENKKGGNGAFRCLCDQFPHSLNHMHTSPLSFLIFLLSENDFLFYLLSLMLRTISVIII